MKSERSTIELPIKRALLERAFIDVLQHVGSTRVHSLQQQEWLQLLDAGEFVVTVEVAVEPVADESPDSFRFVSIDAGGRGGLTSVRLRNVTLNLRDLSIHGSATAGTLVGSLSVPWLLPIGLFQLVLTISNSARIKLSQLHGQVFWTMLKSAKQREGIETADLLKLVNGDLSSYREAAITYSTLLSLLADMENLKCVRQKDGGWKICDRVVVPLDG